MHPRYAGPTCSFSENLVKLYVGAHHWRFVAPSYGNPGSAPGRVSRVRCGRPTPPTTDTGDLIKLVHFFTYGWQAGGSILLECFLVKFVHLWKRDVNKPGTAWSVTASHVQKLYQDHRCFTTALLAALSCKTVAILTVYGHCSFSTGIWLTTGLVICADHQRLTIFTRH